MRIDLAKSSTLVLFSAALAATAGVLALFAGKVWLAAHWGDSSKPELWLKAAKLEPDNPAYWERLGLYEQWTMTNGDLGKAAAYLERAVAAQPRSDQLWMELAGAYEVLGETPRARQAYEEARQAHPISAEVAWRYGSFLLRQGEVSSAFGEIRIALAGKPSLITSAISECWKANPNIDVILNTALPVKSDYYLATLNFLLEQRQLDDAMVVWRRLLALKQPVEMSKAILLTTALIDQNRVVEAQQTWQQTLELTSWPQEKNENGSLVFNGGFEHLPAEGGFDWREQSAPGAQYALDTSVAHSGLQSMRVTFDGSANLDFTHFLQYVPVEPSRSYHFSAYLRTESITTDSGLRFLIYDPFHPANIQIITPNTIGTASWTLMSAWVVTAPDTDLLVIALRRLPSWKFDNKLSGIVWVDDVELVPLEKESKEKMQ